MPWRERKVKRERAIIGLVLITAIFFLLLFVFALLTVRGMQQASDLTASSSIANAKIAVIEIQGAISESKKTIEMLNKAREIKDLKAVILRIDSPGGAVGPTQEIYDEVVYLDKTLPVYASFGGMAASGGYYIGSAARKIFSNRGTLTGSIGVIMQFVNLSKLYEFVKVSPEVVKAGRYKDMGQTARAMTDEEKGLLGGLLSGVHKQFIEDIVKRRKDRIKGNINDLAQGQIFSGEEALSYGLVDELAGLYEAGRKIHAELKIKGEFKGFKFIKEKKPFNFMELMDELGGASEKVGTFLSSLNSQPEPMFKMAN